MSHSPLCLILFFALPPNHPAIQADITNSFAYEGNSCFCLTDLFCMPPLFVIPTLVPPPDLFHALEIAPIIISNGHGSESRIRMIWRGTDDADKVNFSLGQFSPPSPNQPARFLSLRRGSSALRWVEYDYVTPFIVLKLMFAIFINRSFDSCQPHMLTRGENTWH